MRWLSRGFIEFPLPSCSPPGCRVSNGPSLFSLDTSSALPYKLALVAPVKARTSSSSLATRGSFHCAWLVFFSAALALPATLPAEAQEAARDPAYRAFPLLGSPPAGWGGGP